MKINWRVVVGILISLVALWLIAKDVKFDQFAVALAQANYWWALPSTVFILFSIWVRAYRWRALLDNRITPSRAFHITNIGNMLNNVLPIRLGDVARAYLASRNGDVTVMQCFSTVVVERLLDVLTVLGFLMIALPFVSADEHLHSYGYNHSSDGFLCRYCDVHCCSLARTSDSAGSKIVGHGCRKPYATH